MPKKCIAVMSGSYREFFEYSMSRTDAKLVYCGHPTQIKGIEFHEAVEIGKFRERKDAQHIREIVLPMVRLETV